MFMEMQLHTEKCFLFCVTNFIFLVYMLNRNKNEVLHETKMY